MSITFKTTEFNGSKDTHTVVFETKKPALKAQPKLKEGEAFTIFASNEMGGSTVTVLKLRDQKNMSKEDFRVLGGKVFGEFKKNKSKKLALGTKVFSDFESPLESLQGFIEGFMLANYKMTEAKSKPSKSESVAVEVYTSGMKAAEVTKLKTLFKESEAVASAVHFARRLGDLPGNMMTPSILAKNAESLKSTNLKVTVWNKARIKKERMGGLLGVSLGSAEEPKFIIMEYKGKGAKASKPTVLVGKGLTFDAVSH